MGLFDSSCIHQLKIHYCVNVALIVILLGVVAQMIDIRILKGLVRCYGENLIAISSAEEFSLIVEQFQRIPMSWIV